MSEGNSRANYVPTSTIYISKAGRAEESYPQPHHAWWFERQLNSPTGSMGSSLMSSSPSQQSYSSSPDPKVAIPLPSATGWNQWRRDSLKNFYPLDDFATPE